MKKDEKILVKGSPWGVHDMDRPQPAVVTPGSLSSMDPISPPSDAIMLFDGSSLDNFVSVNDDAPAPWTLVDGVVEVAPKTGGIKTKQHFSDCQLHVEWAAPTEITGDGQGRGNSGVFMHDIYEIQILDCFENPTYPDGTTAGIYGQYPPMVNACCKPGEWHIFDILWQAPRFCGDELVRPALCTVMHNGVVVQLHREIHGPTRAAQPVYEAHGPGPIHLQDHGDKVRFRNIWIRSL